MDKDKRIRKFDKQADMYEARRKRQSEREWRAALMGGAYGRVLEVAVGAGANFPFYPEGVEVTAVDFSPAMLAKARGSAAENGVRAAFLQSDIESLRFPDDSFDTIVSTLSFCGYDDPAGVLASFRRWCKPDGRILLMEHGLSTNRLIGVIQKAAEPVFRRVVGCHLDRDMADIFRQSGIRIQRTERRLFDIVHLVWASPDKGRTPGQEKD